MYRSSLVVGEVLYQNEKAYMELQDMDVLLTYNSTRNTTIPLLDIYRSTDVHISYKIPETNELLTTAFESTSENIEVSKSKWSNFLGEIKWSHFVSWRKLRNSIVVASTNNSLVIQLPKVLSKSMTTFIQQKAWDNIRCRVLFVEENRWQRICQYELKYSCKVSIGGFSIDCSFQQYAEIVPYVYNVRSLVAKKMDAKYQEYLMREQAMVKGHLIELRSGLREYLRSSIIVRDFTISILNNGELLKKIETSFQLMITTLQQKAFRIDGKTDKSFTEITFSDGKEFHKLVMYARDGESFMDFYDNYLYNKRKNEEARFHIEVANMASKLKSMETVMAFVEPMVARVFAPVFMNTLAITSFEETLQTETIPSYGMLSRGMTDVQIAWSHSALIYTEKFLPFVKLIESKTPIKSINPFGAEDAIHNYANLHAIWQVLWESAIPYFSSMCAKLLPLTLDGMYSDQPFFAVCYETIQEKVPSFTQDQILMLMSYYFMSTNRVPSYMEYNVLNCYKLLEREYSVYRQHKDAILLEKELFMQQGENRETLKIEDTDLMSGSQFEEFIARLLRQMGFSVSITKASGDQGVDLIATKSNVKYGIQAKCYSNNVSNKAVQEVVGGLAYYGLTSGWVITNSYFTQSARELAVANKIVLWDRDVLEEKMAQL
ncbi:restriction endonuclease [Paenibacillus gansuensis]|uniref:Restriction endonuclease n=1 Tax=Paenibacillus gansuensis TaxID=306542 RepID=A0ABW5PD20_9BACL